MKPNRHRYLVAKPRADGTPRHYWQPTRTLIAHGWAIVRLDAHPDVAGFQASRLNERLDAWYAAGRPALTRTPGVPTAIDGATVDPRPGLRPRFVPARAIAASRGAHYVYVFAGFGGLIKIGVSHDPVGRLRSIRRAAALEIRLVGACGPLNRRDALAAEAECHARLDRYAAGGEWFSLDPATAEREVLAAVRRRFAANRRENLDA